MTDQYIDLISKLILPIVLLVLGVWVKNIALVHERRVSLNAKVVEKRIAIYEQISADLNDIYVFLVQVGHWKDFTPQDIIQRKRHVDKVMYINRPYWSDAMFQKYTCFMLAGFDAWTGLTEDAKIRTSSWQFKLLPNWDDAWESFFTKEQLDIDEISRSYLDLIGTFSEQFGFAQEK